ncbi:MAG: AAA family ATPase [Liquorilactobacillus nagelii]|uniref:AAA family ATPase n=1 Tax=Liquorilactobacillus nagelii TaxID=82688 RepID=UPI0024321B6A|nr:AAA family ATPase [Liquorilactobacillus nagelii]MCI1920464.1 AAA family ATPase [Liquorilactobacillus nagelii]MCI1976108.1 AAA family ATPase [Liquorilactobacillus nagelii]
MTETKFNLLDPLGYIDPGMLNYQEWVNIGMALKREGYSVEDWETWSANDSGRFHEGECEKKWETFDDSTSNPVTGATITQLAKDYGWVSHSSEGNDFIGWDDSFVASDIDKGYKLVKTDYVVGQEIIEPRIWNPAQQIIDYLSTLFSAGDIIGYVNDGYPKLGDEDKWLPNRGVYTKTAGEIIDRLRKCNGDIGAVLGDPNPNVGGWIRFNPLDGQGVKNDNVVDYRYALVESDSMELAQQNEILHKLELPIATLTYSGSKSIHAVIRVDAANYPQYQERVDYLYKIVEKNGLKVDKQNKNPSRLTRLPGFERHGKKQYLIAKNIGKANWEEWEEYIEDMNDNLPEMENMSDLFDKPIVLAPELISGVLRQGHKMLIAGPSKAGKSFSLIQLAIAIAEGWKWLDFQCAQGKVLYVNLELDERSAKKRFVDIYNSIGRGHNHVNNIDVWNLRGKTSPMDKLAPKLIRRAEKADYKAVIIDPIYKVLTGDENNAHDMSLFVNQFDLIATELKCSVIYAHHHSKGSQGGKSSMDRSSGSGVFARDPDAILDLIELPVDEARYDQRVKQAVCNLYNEAIKHYNPMYDEVGLDDLFSEKQMTHHLMTAINSLPNSKTILKEINVQKKLVVEAIKQATAWRIEGTLREFSKFNPVNAWFQYPLHVLDESLQDIKLEDDQKSKWRKGTQKANQSRSEKTQQELEEAFNVLSEDGEAVDVNKIADYLEASKRTVYNRVKKSKKFNADGGMIEKSNNDDK